MEKIFFVPRIKSVIKIKTLTTDNLVCRLHYRITFLFLVVASLMVSATQFFGNPILCDLPDPKFFPVKVVETFCWVESTFTLPKLLDKKVGHEVPYPGVGKHVPGSGDEKVVHAYYQWVCLVLFLQSCMFYAPHLLWRSWEGGKISGLFLELNKPTDLEKRTFKYKSLCNYFMEHKRQNGDYLFKFFFIEILNFVNVVGQIFLMDKFFHGEFTTYGPEVFQFLMSDQEDRIDPMIRVFPRMTKCTFHHYGPSGDVQRLDTFCVLPLNILNEKIYVFLWFWFVILAIVTGLALVYRLTMIMSSTARLLVISSVNYLTKKKNLDSVLHYFDYGDWFLLYMLGNNIDNMHFTELIDEMVAEIQESRKKKAEESQQIERLEYRKPEDQEPKPNESDV